MADDYDRDWVFIIKRLQNQYNSMEKQLCVYLNDTVLLDSTGKLSMIMMMNPKPFMASIKQIDNPSMHQVNKILSGKPTGRFLDLPDELEEPVTLLTTEQSSEKKLKSPENSNVSMETGAAKKENREQRDRERNNWRVYLTRVGKGSLQVTRQTANDV